MCLNNPSVYASAFPAVAQQPQTATAALNVLNIHVQTFISIYSQRKLHHVSTLPHKLSLRVKDSPSCPTEQDIAADRRNHRSTKPVIAVIYYSTYGHIATLAEEVIKGLESTGAIVKPYVMYVEHSTNTASRNHGNR